MDEYETRWAAECDEMEWDAEVAEAIAAERARWMHAVDYALGDERMGLVPIEDVRARLARALSGEGDDE